HHTNIVPVYGVGEHETTHYYVMQFIQGLGLDEVLEELRRLREGKAGSAASRTADVSQVAHALVTGDFRNSVGQAGDASSLLEPAPTNGQPEPGDGAPCTPSAPFPRVSDSSSSIHLPGQSASSSLSESGRQ